MDGDRKRGEGSVRCLGEELAANFTQFQRNKMLKGNDEAEGRRCRGRNMVICSSLPQRASGTVVRLQSEQGIF